MKLKLYSPILILIAAAGCNKDITQDDFAAYAKSHKVGLASDYMLEMENLGGEWEPVMFVFGYADEEGTRIECENAKRGLAKVNFARSYRCVRAN